MKTEKITFRLSEVDKEKLAAVAAAKDISISQLIREACETYLKN